MEEMKKQYEQEVTNSHEAIKLGKLLQSIDASPEEVEAAYKNSGLDTDTVSMKDGHTWWNSQISMSPKGKEYSIQFGTYSKDAFDRVSGLIATIMDEEYAANHY